MAKLDKDAVFRLIDYSPHPGQVAVHASAAKRRVLACGVRWGKSKLAAVEAVCALLAPTPASRGWLVAPSYDLTDALLADVLQAFQGQLAHRVIEAEPRKRRLVVINLAGNRAVLECRSCERPSNLVGAGLDWMIIDEAARIRDEHWETALSQRLTDRNGWLLACSTPRGCRGWFYGAFQRAGEGDPDYEAWSRPTEENALIDPALLAKERERLHRDVYFQEYGGEFVPEHGRVCPVCKGPRADGPCSIRLVEPDDDVLACEECGGPLFRGEAVGYPGPAGLVLKVIDLRPVASDAAQVGGKGVST